MSDTELKPAPLASDLYPNQDPEALDNADEGTVSETVEPLEQNDNPVYPPVNSAYNADVHQELIAATEENLDDVEPHLKEVDFSYAAHADPARQVDRTGVYLDDIVRRDAELKRAAIEGREPDLENPGPTAFDVVQPTSVVQGNAPAGVVVEPAFTQEVMVGKPVTEDVPEDEKPEPYDKNAVPAE